MSKKLIKKSIRCLKQEGVSQFVRKVASYTRNRIMHPSYLREFKDVLFVDGCGDNLPQCSRYRVSHQVEQLEANNLSCSAVYYTELKLEMVHLHRCIVFHRCPMTETIAATIDLARQWNKTVIYDIDDLVFATEYTDRIEYVQKLPAEERRNYDGYVSSMGSVLDKCSIAITTTAQLAAELQKRVPDVFINRNAASEDMCLLSRQAVAAAKRNDGCINIGYLSGSITHNEDFKLIGNVLHKILLEYPAVRLYLVGHIDIPQDFEDVRQQIVVKPFQNWKKLPALIAELDINLAPLTDTIFNRAKSENKWMEAALVKVVTVASDIGAFRESVDNWKTGVLCRDEKDWLEALRKLIEDEKLRRKVAEAAFERAWNDYQTVHNGYGLANFIRSRLHKNAAMILPGLTISGGIMVAMRHLLMLKNAGYDVLVINNGEYKGNEFEFFGEKFPVATVKKDMIDISIDSGIATMWFTTNLFGLYGKFARKYYLVQNYETDFYEPTDYLRIEANRTYSLSNDISYVTISRWCQKWLADKFNQQASFIPNGLDVSAFAPAARDFSGRIKILIEGDSAVYYKNVDESFRIAELLDREKYEIWYVSYNGKPKKWYRVDKFMNRIPYDEMPDVYRQCHILLKTSILESFSYPPLEMMATGGFCVVRMNEGNAEYLQDGTNCLSYEPDDLQTAASAIERLASDEKLRQRLAEGSRQTALNRDWRNIEPQIVNTYFGGINVNENEL